MITVSGLTSAQAALQDAMQDIDIASEEMLAAILNSIAASTMPYVPVDTSALINSEWRLTTMTPDGPIGEIGYGRGGAVSNDGTPVSEYSVYVHEGPQKNWQKPGASNMYLAKGVQDALRDEIPMILKAYE